MNFQWKSKPYDSWWNVPGFIRTFCGPSHNSLQESSIKEILFPKGFWAGWPQLSIIGYHPQVDDPRFIFRWNRKNPENCLFPPKITLALLRGWDQRKPENQREKGCERIQRLWTASMLAFWNILSLVDINHQTSLSKRGRCMICKEKNMHLC